MEQVEEQTSSFADVDTYPDFLKLTAEAHAKYWKQSGSFDMCGTSSCQKELKRRKFWSEGGGRAQRLLELPSSSNSRDLSVYFERFLSQRKYQRLLLILGGKLVFASGNTALHLLDALWYIRELACLSRKSSGLQIQTSVSSRRNRIIPVCEDLYNFDENFTLVFIYTILYIVINCLILLMTFFCEI